MSRDGCGWCGAIWGWADTTRRGARASMPARPLPTMGSACASSMKGWKIFGWMVEHVLDQRKNMTRKQRRLTMIGGSLAVLAVAAALVLNAMRDSIVFFSTPSMAAEKHVPAGKRFRLGGLVQSGSLVRGDNLAVSFKVADG